MREREKKRSFKILFQNGVFKKGAQLLVLYSRPNRVNVHPAHRRPAGVNEKEYKNGGIVPSGRSERSERHDSCIIADYNDTLFFFPTEIAGFTAPRY